MTLIRSLKAYIGVVRFRVIDICEDRNGGFGELIYFNVPFLENIDSGLWRAATNVEKYPFLFKSTIYVLDSTFEVTTCQAIQGCFFNDAVCLKIRPLLSHIDSLPANSTL